MFSLTLIASLLLTQPSEGTIPAPAATDIPTTAGATTAPESKPAPSTGDLLRRIETLEKAEAARTNQSAKQSTAGIFTQTRFTQIFRSLPTSRRLARMSTTRRLRRWLFRDSLTNRTGPASYAGST